MASLGHNELRYQNGHHFTNNISKCIFLVENVCALIEISFKFVYQNPIDNKSVLVQVVITDYYIRHTKSQDLTVSHLVVVSAQSIEARCEVENDVVGAAPTGDAPTTSEWSAGLVPTTVLLI